MEVHSLQIIIITIMINTTTAEEMFYIYVQWILNTLCMHSWLSEILNCQLLTPGSSPNNKLYKTTKSSVFLETLFRFT